MPPIPPPTSTGRDGLRDATPIMVGYVTLGLPAGVLLVAAGLDWWWAPVWSLVIYSGTMQYLLVPLAAAGEPLAAIAASTAFVSGRHVFYGLSFPLERVRAGALARLYAVHAITDEVYALLSTKDRSRMSTRYVLTVEAASQVSWLVGTTLGALAGTAVAGLIGPDVQLLGFVLTALFVVLAIENWRANPDLAVLLLGALASGAGLLVGGSLTLLVSLGTLSAGLLALYAHRSRTGALDQAPRAPHSPSATPTATPTATSTSEGAAPATATTSSTEAHPCR